MLLEMELGGAKYRLDPAAISALRYRAEYGDSILNHLAESKSPHEEEARLLRVCWMMISPADRPELSVFARHARRDGRFYPKARRAVDELLSVDPRMPKGGESGGANFDEYDVVALMSAAHMDMSLLYELPILHLAGIAARYFELQNPEHRERRFMTKEERSALYPRRTKKK